MYRHEYTVPEYQVRGDGSNLFSESSAIIRNLNGVRTWRSRLFSLGKKFWIGFGLTVIFIACMITLVVFAVRNNHSQSLEDVYPENKESVSVIFPNEQPRSDVVVIAPTESVLVKSTTSTTTTTQVPTASPGHNKVPITTAGTTVATADNLSGLTTPSPASGHPPTTSTPLPRRTKGHKPLPANAADRQPLQLLEHMGEQPLYFCLRCEGDIYGVSVTLPNRNNKTVGPVYGNGKRKPRIAVSQLANMELYNIKYDTPPEISSEPGSNCKPEEKC